MMNKQLFNEFDVLKDCIYITVKSKCVLSSCKKKVVQFFSCTV